MISSVLAMALAAAAPGSPSDGLARARRDYSSCLSGFMKKGLKDKMDLDAFGAALGPACAAQEQAFRSAAISVDTAAGIKRAAAEENARMEVADMLANAKEKFEVYKSSNTLLEN